VPGGDAEHDTRGRVCSPASLSRLSKAHPVRTTPPGAINYQLQRSTRPNCINSPLGQRSLGEGDINELPSANGADSYSAWRKAPGNFHELKRALKARFIRRLRRCRYGMLGSATRTQRRATSRAIARNIDRPILHQRLTRVEILSTINSQPSTYPHAPRNSSAENESGANQRVYGIHQPPGRRTFEGDWPPKLSSEGGINHQLRATRKIFRLQLSDLSL
jgi:hypothetical protein